MSEIDNPASFHAEAVYQGRCAGCGSTGEFHAHHVISKSKCKQIGAPLHDPDDALRACSMPITGCHWRHEHAQEQLELSALRDENLTFAVRWMGAGPAEVYLRRHYGGSDDRLDRLAAYLTPD